MMTKEAAAARRAYKNKWARENRDKTRQYEATYWQRVAEKNAAQQAAAEQRTGENN